MNAGHGANIGHGYAKYVVITQSGQELPPVIFPALVAPATRSAAGALVKTDAVKIANTRYWTGEDALLSAAPMTMISQERLANHVYIPALVAGALQRLGNLNGSSKGVCVTGLPASWAEDRQKCQQIGDRLRAATNNYTSIRVIAEPLGLIYSMLLDNNGMITGDSALQDGKIAVVDMGHYTDDVVVVDKMRPILNSLQTYQLGTAKPLQNIRAQLTAHFERDFSLYEVDQAVRQGSIRSAGQMRPLPRHWDAPLIENSEALATKLVETFGRGADLDSIILGGGGAELAYKVNAIRKRFPQTQVAPDPQIAIARGYARLARRFGAKK